MVLFKKKPAPPQEDVRWEALNAEYMNYRRRTSAQLEAAEAQSARKTVQEFLPIYDDLLRALGSTCSDQAFYQGVSLILRELNETFSRLGVQPMDSKGKIFNPVYHEAVEHIVDPKYRAGEIVEVVRIGFTMDEEVLRHAKVVVANCE